MKKTTDMKNDISKTRSLLITGVKNKWVFKIKCNTVHWVRLVACGYSHAPRVDFSKKYSVIHILHHTNKGYPFWLLG